MAGLSPTTGVWVVTAHDLKWLPASQVTSEVVGVKAFGLTTIPQDWTPPFFVIAPDLFELLKSNKEHFDHCLRPQFWQRISDAAAKISIKTGELVYLRSSAITENVDERGKYHSVNGPFSNIVDLISSCCHGLLQDSETAQSSIAFIIQKQVSPIRSRGHLSNERRLSEEARDWVYELEDVVDGKLDAGRIPIRTWRERRFVRPTSLACRYDLHLPATLKIAARWAGAARVHCEWVWNGERVFLVQADQVRPITGVDPTKVCANYSFGPTKFALNVFRSVTPSDGQRFTKVRNALVYKALGISTSPLFILSDPAVLSELGHGRVPKQLQQDLKTLVKSSLVLRTDIDTDELADKQMLPRSDEVRTVENAQSHLIQTLRSIIRSGVDVSKVAILAHHFIPAVTSAWAYADPKSRKVLIEALWGIPEGLYYYAHDTFEVDTMRIDPTKIRDHDYPKFVVQKKLRHKKHFVMPTSTGQWKTHTIAEPHDWRPSVREKRWLSQIAHQTRLIAKKEARAINVMWFVDLPSTTGLPKVIPWYHESSPQRPQARRSGLRKKMVTDREHFIETVKDIEELEKSYNKGQLGIKRIRIRPTDDSLLRSKEFAVQIGQLARKLEAVIVLEGSLLSHTYYILCRTGAQVETLDSYVGDDENQDFNKLVRDRIPQHIVGLGEKVTVARLNAEDLVRELRKKLVEESIEALDASDHETLEEELADVMEVISALITKLRIQKGAIENRKKRKKRSKGGFTEGYVLLETRNPSVTTDTTEEVEEDLLGDRKTTQGATVKPARPSLPSILLRSIDKRQLEEGTEGLLTIVVPILADKWESDSGELSIADGLGRELRFRLRLKGKRIGSTLRFELSAITTPEQLELESFPMPEKGSATKLRRGKR